jgi:uncharacterized phage-associated protein
VHLAKYNRPLFDEKILAFQNGSVIEEVRRLYRNDHDQFVDQANKTNLRLTSEQLDTLLTVEEIFGELSARELSDLNHQHQSWKEAYENSRIGSFHEKQLSEITLSQLQKHEVPKVQEILEAHYSGMSLVAFEVVNDRKFYYDPEQIQITDEVLAMLESFDGQDSAYSLYLDETAGIVIY